MGAGRARYLMPRRGRPRAAPLAAAAGGRRRPRREEAAAPCSAAAAAAAARRGARRCPAWRAARGQRRHIAGGRHRAPHRGPAGGSAEAVPACPPAHRRAGAGRSGAGPNRGRLPRCRARGPAEGAALTSPPALVGSASRAPRSANTRHGNVGYQEAKPGERQHIPTNQTDPE